MLHRKRYGNCRSDGNRKAAFGDLYLMISTAAWKSLRKKRSAFSTVPTALTTARPSEIRGTKHNISFTPTFRQYGLPERMTMDNGAPWGDDLQHRFTPLTVWLIRLGVAISHSRPYHPQTQGKDERFHRTLDVDLLRWHSFHDRAHVQKHFDEYRDIYNRERPHQALGLHVPASRYRLSTRRFPEQLPSIEYDVSDIVRKVHAKGHFQYRGKRY